jgi:hypothetical protein
VASDDDVSRLYALPLEDFTGERDALAKRLRADGEREAASEVKALKKPNLPAWAINQGVRSNPEAAERLVEAGERLGDAQSAALEGKGAVKLREAMAGQQEAVERMMRAVGDKLDRGNRTDAILDRARETLRALAGDEELRADFAAGRLTRDREAVGFGGAQIAPVPRAKRAAKKKPSATAATRRRQAERAERQAANSLEIAAKRVKEAKRRLERAQAAVESAREEQKEADREQAERESELNDARSVVQELRE